jgi:hypothetical protein
MNLTQTTLRRLVALSLVFVLASCAPVGDPGPGDKSSTNFEDTPPNVEPAPAPVFQPAPAALQPDVLKSRIMMAVEQVRQREVRTDNGFWTVFHGILGLGPSVMLQDPGTGSHVNALDYISNGGKIRGLRFIETKDGLDVLTAPAPDVPLFVGQGHQDQFVAEMAQWHCPADRKFIVNGKHYTFMDFVRHTKARARVTADQELSWAIVILGQYLGTDIAWTNNVGEKLTFEDLVRYEVTAPIEDAACGGTHRLFGLDWVYYLHLNKGGANTGVWQDVAARTVKYQQLARALQNPDGSFSTDFFRGRGNARDMQLRMNTTGHILEWLALSLPKQELKSPWVEQAVSALTQMFMDIRGTAMESGTMYHAIHGLLIYYARVYDGRDLGAQQPHMPLPPEVLSARKP